MRVIGIVGWKNNGKTTLVVRLVEHLVARDLGIAGFVCRQVARVLFRCSMQLGADASQFPAHFPAIHSRQQLPRFHFLARGDHRLLQWAIEWNGHKPAQHGLDGALAAGVIGEGRQQGREQQGCRRQAELSGARADCVAGRNERLP